MTRKSLAIASVLLVLTMLVIAFFVANLLPADAQLPTHFGIDGKPDRFADKWTALLMPPLIVGVVSLIFYAMPALEPKERGLARSQGLYLTGWAVMLLIFGIVELAVVSLALGWSIPVNRVAALGLGVALVLIGNQLGKSRRMFLIGIRTPWTLASEEVWIKTHRLGGKLMVAAGLAVALAALLAVPSEILFGIIIGTVLVAAVVPVVYSFLVWRQERRQGQPSE